MIKVLKFRKKLLGIAVFIIMGVLTACGSSNTTADKEQITAQEAYDITLETYYKYSQDLYVFRSHHEVDKGEYWEVTMVVSCSGGTFDKVYTNTYKVDKDTQECKQENSTTSYEWYD